MMKLNPEIYHRRSIRLPGYDYSGKGLYFITICCYNRLCLFGEIMDGVQNPVGAQNFVPQQREPQQSKTTKRMVLNDTGMVAHNCWLDIPVHFPNVVLHAHIVMPDHIHGIIELISGKDTMVGVKNPVGIQTNVGAQNFVPLQREPLQSKRKQNEFQKIVPRSVGSIVRGYKTGVTKWVRRHTEIQNVWQRNYYEHIIRDHTSYRAISNYIITNPARWDEDKFRDA
jgi:putative transposase